MQRLLTALGGPVFAKEMLETARRKRYYLNRVLYLLALFVVVWILYEDSSYGRTAQVTIQQAARFASELFLAVSITQYCAVWLLVPVFVCGLVASERESHTLELLLTSRLADREIVVGKLASRLAIVTLILLCSLPIVALIGTFGGVDAQSVWRTLNSTLLAMLFSGAFSIYFSVDSRSPTGALVRSYWWMAVWLLGLPMGTILVFEFLDVRPNTPGAIFLYVQGLLNPIFSFIVAVEPQAEREISQALGNWYLYWMLFAMPTLWSGWLIWRAVRRLRRDPTEAWLVRLGRWMLRALPGAREVADGHRGRKALRRRAAARWLGVFSVSNPVWLRARLARVYDREGYIGRIQLGGWAAAIGFLLLFALAEPQSMDDDDAAIAFLMPIWIALGLLLVVVSASSLVSDKRRGFFELLLVTTLTPREIFDGTLLAVWQHVRSTWRLAAAFTALFVLFGAIELDMALVSLISGTLFAGVVATLGVSTALAARALPQSLIPTFILPIAMTVGTGLLIGTCEEASGPIAWVLLMLAVPACVGWLAVRNSATAIGASFIVIHMLFVFPATALSIFREAELAPLGLCNPAPMIIGVLCEENVGDLFHWRGGGGPFDASMYVLAWWIAMLANIVWMRWWILRRFDRITGRVARRALAAQDDAPAPKRPRVDAAPQESIA